VVKPGDTLSSISRTYSVPLEALFAANQLQSPNIRVGQKLNIPAAVSEEPSGKKTESAPLPPSAEAAPPPTKWEKERTETYTVKPGDTLFKIALQHGVTVESLSGANNISATDILRVGQTLMIPNSNNTEVAKN
jgi:LysM repeat protein